MPEGHSVHRLARQFASVFLGERLTVSSPQGRFAAGAERLDGEVLTGSRAHGKQLFLTFSNDLELRVHLGLYGAWSFGGDETFTGASSIGAPRKVGERETYDDGPLPPYAGPPEPVGAVRVRLVSQHGWADLRGPTACEVITAEESARLQAKLGPDPLDPGADVDAFIRAVQASSSPVATLLMNQAVIAGVGNVYRAEVLFRQGLDPMAQGRSLSRDEVQGLWDDVVSAMREGVRDGRIVTTDRHYWSGEAASPEDAHFVYQRSGQPCRVCGSPVLMSELGARKLYWCPVCQA